MVTITSKMFRIKQYPKGYVVEIQKRKWYGEKYWTHFISVAGIESKPWHFSSFGYALEGLRDEIVSQVTNNS